MTNARVAVARDKMRVVRRMTGSFLDGLTPDQWFWTPGEGLTFIAWQVAHLAFAEYGLLMKRQRGARPEDAQLISESFIKRYGRGSIPNPDPAANDPIDAICEAFDAIHAQAQEELLGYTDAELDVPIEGTHPMFSTKLTALEFAPIHEAMHVGQIILLRRLMGLPASW